MNKLICISFLFLTSSFVNAAVTESGAVNNIILEANIVSFWLSGPNATNGCAGGARWTLEENDSLFREKYSAILASVVSGKTVHAKSTGACREWDSNRVYYINFET